MSALVSVEIDGPVRTLTLLRADKRNALSAALVEELLAAVAESDAAGTAVLVLRGDGRCFSAGFDMGGYESQSEGDLVLRFVRIELLLQAVARSPSLTIGLAHGRNFGAGVDLFAVCRHRIATPDCSFRMPGLGFGLVLGSRRFGELVGHERAIAILGARETFPAEEGAAMGFVHRIVEQDRWSEAVAAQVARLDGLDGETRAALYRALDRSDDDRDLADLARSAAKPGLKDRIARYLA